MHWVMEHEYLAKGLTETALPVTTLWAVLTKNFCSAESIPFQLYCKLMDCKHASCV